MTIFSAEQSWAMTETEKVVALIKEVQCWRLGNWDGCCCSEFSVRNVSVQINCGKGAEQAVWVSSQSMDYYDRSRLKPIMDEVIQQVSAQSGRSRPFAQYYDEWRPSSANAPSINAAGLAAFLADVPEPESREDETDRRMVPRTE